MGTLDFMDVGFWPLQLDNPMWWEHWGWVPLLVYVVLVLVVADNTRYGDRCSKNKDCSSTHAHVAFWSIGLLFFLGIIPALVAIWYFATHDPPCVKTICPHCKEEIQKGANVCKHCGRETGIVNDTVVEVATGEAKNEPTPWWVPVFVVILGVGALYVLYLAWVFVVGILTALF